MNERIDIKRLLIFLALAFGISWATALVIYLIGGLENSPSLVVADMPVSLAFVLLATSYMFGPALANILTRIITKESKENLYLRPYFDHGRWKYYLAAWLMPGVLTIVGMVAFFLIFPGYFDPELALLKEQLQASSAPAKLSPWIIVIVQTLQAMILSPLLNGIPTFGEEFGWRGYLQPKLMPLGGRKAVVLTGLIWGIWHWPVIWMGYNYGMDYFGAPYLGPLAMVWFTLILSVIFGWVTIQSKNVWPAVIAHGAINGIASLSLLFSQGKPDPILGPTPVGLIGGMGFTIFALVILLLPNSLTRKEIGALQE